MHIMTRVFVSLFFCKVDDAVVIGTGEVQVPAHDDETPIAAALEEFKPSEVDTAKAGTGKRHTASELDDDDDVDEAGEDIAVAAEAHGDGDDADVDAEDESDDENDAEDAPSFGAAGKWKAPAFFPMHFGRSRGGAVAVANSYSVRGAAISHAVAHGAPARRRKATTPKPTVVAV